MSEILDRVYHTICARRDARSENSYVATLFAKGRTHIAKKVGEEATEVAMSAALEDREEVIYESADILFHLMVLWADMGITPQDIDAELARREGVSGLTEKASRSEG